MNLIWIGDSDELREARGWMTSRQIVKMKDKLYRKELRKRGNRNLSPEGSHRYQLWENQGEKCRYCECKLTFEEATIDHVIPLSRGGANAWGNKVVACIFCNGDKGSQLLSEWAEFTILCRHPEGLCGVADERE